MQGLTRPGPKARRIQGAYAHLSPAPCLAALQRSLGGLLDVGLEGPYGETFARGGMSVKTLPTK